MQTFEGIVTGVKTPQTVAVEVSFVQKHPQYKKIIKRTTKLLVHNELEGVKAGDKVQIIKSRPYSKMKHFKLLNILSARAQISEKESVKEVPLKEEKPKIKKSEKGKTEVKREK